MWGKNAWGEKGGGGRGEGGAAWTNREILKNKSVRHLTREDRDEKAFPLHPHAPFFSGVMLRFLPLQALFHFFIVPF